MTVERKPNSNSRWTRIRRIYVNRMFPIRQDALKVGFSVAAGVFIGIWPTIGVAIILTVAFCAAFKLPKIPGVVSSFVANPVTQFGFFYPGGYLMGCKLIKPKAIDFDFLEKFEDLSWNNLTEILGYLWTNAADHLLAFMIGITIMAAIGGFIFFWIGYGVVTYRQKRHLETKSKFIKNLMQEDSEILSETRKMQALAEQTKEN